MFKKLLTSWSRSFLALTAYIIAAAVYFKWHTEKPDFEHFMFWRILTVGFGFNFLGTLFRDVSDNAKVTKFPGLNFIFGTMIIVPVIGVIDHFFNSPVTEFLIWPSFIAVVVIMMTVPLSRPPQQNSPTEGK